MSRLTRDGTAEPVSRDQILRHVRGQGNIIFPCSADHEQDWQPYPVDPYSAICDDHTYISIRCVFAFQWRKVPCVVRQVSFTLLIWNWIIGTGWNWNSGNNRVRCSPDWSVYRCIERYCMTPRQRDDDNNLSVGNRNHLKLGIEPESWLQSHELGF